MRALLFGGLIVVAATLTGRADVPVPKPPVRKPPSTDYDAMRFHMHQSFDLVRAIERLLLRGKLDDARRFAEAIAIAPDPPAHGAWATHVVKVRDRAAALARATTIDEAIAADAQLAGACAGCHVELGVANDFGRAPAAPPDEPTLAARMIRHRWAADRLWEGVIAGADAPWRSGLDVLAAPPLETFGPDRVEYARTLRRLAENARRNKRLDLDRRATTYGALLATCAGCHTAPATPPAAPVRRR